ncbi:helix-turn-helix domain-containing protein [uncultured Thiocystis sp.]|uniref:helix-turn-helix domain-containing protein n=1 Tax=uncultured Thiocystis sp. TaxID=1202134 RepID=UPI0034325099
MPAGSSDRPEQGTLTQKVVPMESANEPLLWNLDEVARQLGGVSARTIRRLVDRGELPKVRVSRRLMVPSAAVRDYVANGCCSAENARGVEQGALAPTRGDRACLSKPKGSLKNRTAATGTLTSPTRAVVELNALLGL